MEPRLFYRGKDEYIAKLFNVSAASMEPRLFYRGKRRDLQRSRRAKLASMEPRLFYRGKGDRSASPFRDNGLQWSRGCSTAERLSVSTKALCAAGASMEPRLFYRGKELFACVIVYRLRLQWSRGCSTAERSHTLRCMHVANRFNGAAVVLPRKDKTLLALMDADEASMEPRLFYRGKETGRHDLRRSRTASMEPRLFYRGKRHHGLDVLPPLELQWSRGCSTAEREAGASLPTRSRSLQWSRGCSTAERCARIAALAHKDCFNGAAVVLPRKAAHVNFVSAG